MRLLLLAFLAAIMLCMPGCKEEKEVKTVQWYREHPEELQKQYDICRNNPGQLKDDPNCVNAMQARMIDSGGKASDLKLPQ